MKTNSRVSSRLSNKLPRTILEILETQAEITTSGIVAMLLSGRSTKRYYQILNGVPPKRQTTPWKERSEDCKKYYVLLARLEKQGLVTSGKSSRGRFWKITSKAIVYLESERKRLFKINEMTSEGGITVISYDIPEKMSTDRRRLRETLQMLGFEQAHKSVWFANKSITRHFLEYLRERKLIDHVHIFEITKTGTLQRHSL